MVTTEEKESESVLMLDTELASDSLADKLDMVVIRDIQVMPFMLAEVTDSTVIKTVMQAMVRVIIRPKPMHHSPVTSLSMVKAKFTTAKDSDLVADSVADLVADLDQLLAALAA